MFETSAICLINNMAAATMPTPTAMVRSVNTVSPNVVKSTPTSARGARRIERK